MRKQKAIALLCSITFGVLAPLGHAAPPDQAGEISFEAHDDDFDPSEIQDRVISKLDQVSSTKSPGEPFSANEILYLNGAYLYCSIQGGACPLPLEALLELDILRAKTAPSNDACPALTAFWRSWMKNGLEDRHRYNIKTAHIGATNEFTDKVRPRYIRCADAVRSEKGRQVDFEKVSSLASFLRTIKDRKVNVFPAAPAKKEDPADVKKKKKRKPEKK